ncbi:Uncharacterised protein [Shigella sonnei]|uniref:Uncharacterized protein n=1 Tax=Shigella sonnei TaxID=624 RepID=A0AAN2UB06_SHISO|nr:Uncharacterised protein [Shigella sonnei]CSF47274.1 Uncharacterised protein [Shigella sonnei]CSG19135.1 Uncharacterised protein [Shigella sonnei]CSI11342.1 Uncharacterised protein [Shigella sonnei]CSI66889.1 Uncharacterised protein [Shigella sonnei]
MIGNFNPKKNKIVVRDFFNILRVCILMCLYIFRLNFIKGFNIKNII